MAKEYITLLDLIKVTGALVISETLLWCLNSQQLLAFQLNFFSGKTFFLPELFVSIGSA